MSTSPLVTKQSRAVLAAMIVAMETQRRELSDEIAHCRSILRNDLAGEKWRGDFGNVKLAVDFKPGRFLPVAVRRDPDGCIVFRRRRMDPYMKVREVA